jgi:hypothetical protein
VIPKWSICNHLSHLNGQTLMKRVCIPEERWCLEWPIDVFMSTWMKIYELSYTITKDIQIVRQKFFFGSPQTIWTVVENTSIHMTVTEPHSDANWYPCLSPLSEHPSFHSSVTMTWNCVCETGGRKQRGGNGTSPGYVTHPQLSSFGSSSDKVQPEQHIEDLLQLILSLRPSSGI